MNQVTNLYDKIALGTSSAIQFLSSGPKESIEVRRIGLCALSLMMSGASEVNLLNRYIAHYIKNWQQPDGGWNDVEETLVAVKLLSMIGSDLTNAVERGKNWLLCQHNPDGGWGRTNRDISRIPITGLVLHLLPELSSQIDIMWLKTRWAKDIRKDTTLSYKGGFFLLGLSAIGVSRETCSLIDDTYSFLESEQNKDGGFGPWRDHPVGSDPWSTGVVLLGLLSYPELVSREILATTVGWLVDSQLPNGLWPYHYLDEGSAYAYWGLVEALKFLSRDS